MRKRGSGVLLHITSLPSPFGIGDLGPWARRFADFLARSKQSYWQILPLNYTEGDFANSPYHSVSAFAGNPLLISPELLVQEGLLAETDLEPITNWPSGEIDYNAVIPYKKKLLASAYQSFRKRKQRYEYEKFCAENSWWLDDFSLFAALKQHLKGLTWNQWPAEIRDRDPKRLDSLKKEHEERIQYEKFLQFVFIQQWLSLKKYCNNRGISIIGDLPIYVVYDSVDLWVNPELFKLDQQKRPYVVAGVPPDYYSETGQLWGNPVYRWDVLKKTGYDWWVKRITYNLSLFDFLRIDHFRGLVAYWEIPAGEKNAVKGKWVEVPVVDFFNRLSKLNPSLPLIAEDLGYITPQVREIMQLFDLPGMKVLLFAFGDDLSTNPYLPHNIVKKSIVYTGTHDNNTVRGWFEKEATPEIRRRVFDYLGREVPAENIHWELIRLAMMSVANLAIIPMQDILGLGEEARMNDPAGSDKNWKWRLRPEQLTPSVAEKLLQMTEIYGRA